MRSVVPLLFLIASMAFAVPNSLAAAPPKLVVLIVIDQFRPDYLTRFAPHYLPARDGDRLGGFKLLMEEGAYYPNAWYAHVATFTCPGHAAISSGSLPSASGVIANAWLDRRSGQPVHCVTDQRGIEGIPRSPEHLRVTTLGDEMKLASQGRSKVITMAYKDYSAMMLGGRMADLALWLDLQSGNWTSNPYYLSSSPLPAWVTQLNQLGIPDAYRGQAWTRLLPESAYGPQPAGNTAFPIPLGANFPHQLGDGAVFYRNYAQSAYGNEFVFESAKKAIEGAGLASGQAPDLLAIGLSTNDYVGHFFGPNSAQVMDVSLRTDRLLSDFLNYLSEEIGMSNLVLAVTSDHGVQAIPSEVVSGRGLGGVVARQQLIDTVEGALDARFGPRDWVAGASDIDLYFNPQTLGATQLEPADLEKVASQAATSLEGILAAYGRTQILQGRLPDNDLSRRIANTFHPDRSGDLILIYESNWYMEEQIITTHGTHYASNSRVPILLWGNGIKGGQFYRSVDPRDIAATLSQLLGIPPPSASTGQVLIEALQ